MNANAAFIGIVHVGVLEIWFFWSIYLIVSFTWSVAHLKMHTFLYCRL